MIYKALMLDVDGTLVPYDYNALPSEKVQNLISKAREHVTVCVATGRSFAFVEPVLKALAIDHGLAIVNNGAQVVDITTKKVYYDQPIFDQDLDEIIARLSPANFPFFVNEGFNDFLYETSYKPTKVYNIYTRELFTREQIDSVIHHLRGLPSLSLQETTHHERDKFGLIITHAKATKQHGILEVAKMLDIKPSHIVGVGDGYNDFPLFMACGLRVAMGNANDDLKQIADYIAPSVDDDGVAHVIEKYILMSDEV